MMKIVVMIGPSPRSHGGMASVISTFIKAGYLEENKHIFISTQVDGGVFRKVLIASWSYFRFIYLLLTGRVGLLHAHVASGLSFWRKFAFISTAQLAGCPVVFHLHGGKFRHFIERQPPWRRQISLSLMRRCSHILALTKDTSEWLAEIIQSKPITTFPNPIIFESGRLHERPLNVLFLGRISEEKGIFDLLSAFATVNKQLAEARLIIGGDGDVSAAKDFSEKLGILNAVRFVGWLDEVARAEWLDNSAVFVLPSLFEQMPMTILEAMAAGTPIVATRVGAIPDMLEKGKCGTLVEPGNSATLAKSIYAVLDNPKTAQAMAGRAISRVNSTYSADQVLQRLERLYSTLM